MTVIVYKGGAMAADSGSLHYGRSILSGTVPQKVRRFVRELGERRALSILIAGFGEAAIMEKVFASAYRRLFSHGIELHSRRDFYEFCGALCEEIPGNPEDVAGLLISIRLYDTVGMEERVFELSSFGALELEVPDGIAGGSGGAFAMGALAVGATLEEAADAAAHLDPYCRAPIVVLRHPADFEEAVFMYEDQRVKG